MSANLSDRRDATNFSSLMEAMRIGVGDGELSIMSDPPSREGSTNIFDRIEPTVWVGHSAETETGEPGLVNSNFTCAMSAILWRPTMVMVCRYTESGEPIVAERDELPFVSEEKNIDFNGNPVLVVNGRIFSFEDSDLPRSQWRLPNPRWGEDEDGRPRNGQVLSWFPKKVVELEYRRNW